MDIKENDLFWIRQRKQYDAEGRVLEKVCYLFANKIYLPVNNVAFIWFSLIQLLWDLNLKSRLFQERKAETQKICLFQWAYFILKLLFVHYVLCAFSSVSKIC